MSAHPVEHGDEPIIERPDRTIAALRQALARVAPSKLSLMESERDEVLTLAAETQSVGPVNGFLLRWAALVEIERHPATARRLHDAERRVRTALDEGTMRAAAREVADIKAAARQAVGG
ncbi:hypothetical protein [Streptomyces griseocarneus]|uniref:hypothetical protein n=1 Tax=Streptomyces griseocarneus TaxID=51201 RepID=UPI00167C812E|nr:hypothetical protein [Streptomyces griseocarneus]MBZ6472148.1 hypothetical protein [Streptomyces griseocarneus]GHG73594.1 hypothetical protein GCM10018779_49890 [Streptomyces griseocarneus]